MKLVIPGLVTLAVCGALAVGCSKKEATEAPAGGGAAEAAEEPLLEGLEGLDAETLALVRAQENCPVSGEALGSMGAPIRKDVDGKAVFLCCKSCNKKFEADPQKYLSMVEGG
ncbi:MAG: hypothetical protein ACF8XB_01025 [Planctomycetota bacterium JB042]